MAEKKEKVAADSVSEASEACGVVMPIAPFAEYDASHWINVRDIITRAIRAAGLEPKAVWEGGNVEIIHDRIVFNLFELNVAVVDVSGMNPNVMFELGMRLTVGKPTVIICDNSTKIPFDTGLIEHLIYERDLTFHGVEKFIEKLGDRLGAVIAASKDGSYKPFIRRFGTFEIPKIESEEVSVEAILLQKLENLEEAILSRSPQRYQNALSSYLNPPYKNDARGYTTSPLNRAAAIAIVDRIKGITGVADVEIISLGGTNRLRAIFAESASNEDYQRSVKMIEALVANAKK